MKLLKKITLKCIYILLIIYLSIFIPVFWGYKPLVVISGSMEPILKVGGLLYYHSEEYSNINKNDILVYKTKKHIVSHRVISKDKNSFITKGDANKSNDFNPVQLSKILGKGTNWSIPYLGIYADFIYTHKYILYILIFILCIDLCNSLRKKGNNIDEEKNY